MEEERKDRSTSRVLVRSDERMLSLFPVFHPINSTGTNLS